MTGDFKKWLNVAIAAAFLAVLLFWPYDSLDMPEWRIEVVDENGQPAPGVAVREAWASPIVKSKTLYIYDATDHDGSVTFPPGYVHASVARRVMTYVFSKKEGLLSPRVIACSQDKTGQVIWEDVHQEPGHRLVLHHGSCVH